MTKLTFKDGKIILKTNDVFGDVTSLPDELKRFIASNVNDFVYRPQSDNFQYIGPDAEL